MSPLIFRTAGESHGPCGLAMIEGLPAGLRLDEDLINSALAHRQGGYGRGGRQRIETDRAEFLTGLRNGVTMGGPLTIQVVNKDSRLDDAKRTPPVYRPRPGHADLAGAMKWLTTDCRDTLERASARETAARTAAGAVARCLLREFGIETFGFVRGLLDVDTEVEITQDRLDELRGLRDASVMYCPDEPVTEAMVGHIRQAKIDKDTLGGLCEAVVFGCPYGLGSCTQWSEKLDGRLAQAVMSIQAFKAVEIGLGAQCARRPGSQVHDAIVYDESARQSPNAGFVRLRNNAGGIEGGMTNAMPVVVRGTMKPISTLLQGMESVNLNTKKSERSDYERSDVCALSAASVVMEHVIAFQVAASFMDKFGGDSMLELHANYKAYNQLLQQLPFDKLAAGGNDADQSEA
jgi:chorismate synthase